MKVGKHKAFSEQHANPKSKTQNLKYPFIFSLLFSFQASAQLQWQNVDSLFGPLPASVHVYRTTGNIDGKPNIAYYFEADLKDKNLEFTADTTFKRRLKPSEFYAKNEQPLLVVNTTFFSFATHQNLNLVIKDKKLVGYNIHTVNGRGKDTFTYRHPLGSALGISKKRNADVAWLFTDSSYKHAFAVEVPVMPLKDSSSRFPIRTVFAQMNSHPGATFRGMIKHSKWKMETAVGGGPVLVQNGKIQVTNNEEIKFAGKAIDDKHPRTAMGYTWDNKLIILVVEGRNTGKAEGASLTQMAQILRDLNCKEALNLDGGGSSCMLVNGKETIKVSDAAGQRAVPGVFVIKAKR